jgi:hypothetical protein
MMTAFHGQGGHATSHFKRWKSTPVQPDTSREDEAKARNQLNRVDPELCNRGGDSNHWADYRVSTLFYPHFFIRHWLDCLDFHWRIGAALVSRSTAV